MAKRNRVLLGILVAAVLALLIALCFVGNTFARYTLKQEESVTVEIAEWEITLEDSSNETVEAGDASKFASSVSDLKPSADKYDGTTARQTTAGEYFVCVAELTNTGDVAADVTLAEESVQASDAEYETFSSVDDLVAKGSAYGVTSSSGNYTEVIEDGSTTGYTYTPGNDSGYAGYETTGSGYANEIGSHITADVYYDTEGALTSGSEENKLTSTGVTLYPEDTATVEQISSIYIYLDIIWLSDLTVENELVDGDGFDTWCGTWVKGFSFGLTIEAVQAADNT